MIGQRRRWDPCVDHRDDTARAFVQDYWGADSRRILIIAGVGFDPRAGIIAQLLYDAAGSRVSAVFVREERPSTDAALTARATANLLAMQAAIPRHALVSIQVFAADNAVTGGRTVVGELGQTLNALIDGISDVVVDFSGLSIGISFPIAKYLLQRFTRVGPNLHVMVVSDPELDSEIRPIPGESPNAIHGFAGRLRLEETARAAKLWVPQLTRGQRPILDIIHREVAPHDICPILPFPARSPNAGDMLAEEYQDELRGIWDVDLRNIIYADEEDPLDVYRTLLEVDDAREPVFRSVGGSLSILSPVGSKVVAMGVLMAAVERDFPVVYVEALGFSVGQTALANWSMDRGRLAHVWLSGDAYPPHSSDRSPDATIE